MRQTEFLHAVRAQFGDLAPTMLRDHAIGSLGGVSAADALAAGIPPRQVWEALCESAEVPKSERVPERLPEAKGRSQTRRGSFEYPY